MTGFVGSQSYLLSGDYSRFGFWSWEDRSLQSHTSEVVTVGTAWRGDPCGWNCPNDRRGRENGNTYRQRWAHARQLNVEIAFIPSFNQWTGCNSNPGENMNAEFSTDIEPSYEHGTLYLDITREEAAKFKANVKN